MKNLREISMYLLKRDQNPEDVLKNHTTEESDVAGTNDTRLQPLHWHPSNENIKSMYGYIESDEKPYINAFEIRPEHAAQMKNRRPYCILFVKFIAEESENSERWMAITTGCGKELINLNTMEHDFGLYTVLNIVNPDKITNMGFKATVGKMPSFSGIIPKGGKTVDFRLKKMDILKKMAGKENNDEEGNAGITVTGADMLKVRFKYNITLENLPSICERYYKIYNENTYQQVYPSLLDIQRERSAHIVLLLNEKLVNAIQQRMDVNISDQTTLESTLSCLELVHPFTDELVVGGKVRFMNFKKGRTSIPFYDSLCLDNYLTEIKRNSAEENIFKNKNDPKAIIKLLEQHMVMLYGGKKWSIKRCLSYDTMHEGYRYIHQDGVWYKLSHNLIKTVTEHFKERCRNTTLICYNKENHANEGVYNEKTAREKGYLNMDDKNIKIENVDFEICDLMSYDDTTNPISGDMFYVKKYKGNSDDIVYLFHQGLRTAEFLQQPHILQDICDKVNTIGGAEGGKYKKVIQESVKNPQILTMSYAVIKNKPQNNRIVHSQGSSSNVNDNLLSLNLLMSFYFYSVAIENFGYKVSFEWIKNIKSETDDTGDNTDGKNVGNIPKVDTTASFDSGFGGESNSFVSKIEKMYS